MRIRARNENRIRKSKGKEMRIRSEITEMAEKG